MYFNVNLLNIHIAFLSCKIGLNSNMHNISRVHPFIEFICLEEQEYDYQSDAASLLLTIQDEVQ